MHRNQFTRMARLNVGQEMIIEATTREMSKVFWSCNTLLTHKVEVVINVISGVIIAKRIR